jgi:Mg2+-importing ATPase
LLNNFIADVPDITISSDNVDEELLKKPKKWNLNLIYQSMIYFGILCSFFDIILISVLLLSGVSTEIFRTAWFTESVLSEILIFFALRTSRPFFKSRPSNLLIITTILAALASIIITYLTVGSNFFEFAAMPLWVLGLIAGVLIVYFAAAEFLKKKIFGKIGFI